MLNSNTEDKITIKQSSTGFIIFYSFIYSIVILFYTFIFYLYRESIAKQVGGPHPNIEWILYSVMMAICGILVIIVIIILHFYYRPLIIFSKNELVIESPFKKNYKKIKYEKKLDNETRLLLESQKIHNNIEYYLVQNEGIIKIFYRDIYKIIFTKNFLTFIFKTGNLTILSNKGEMNISSIKRKEIELAIKKTRIKYIEK